MILYRIFFVDQFGVSFSEDWHAATPHTIDERIIEGYDNEARRYYRNLRMRIYGCRDYRLYRYTNIQSPNSFERVLIAANEA